MSEQPVHDTNEMMRRRNQAVTEQLLGELEAGRFDSPLTKRILAPPSAFPRLLRACYLAAAGEREQTRSDIEFALEHVRDNPVVELVAGMLLAVLDDHDAALARFDQALALSGKTAARVRQLRAAVLVRQRGGDPYVDDAEWIEPAKRMLLRALAMYSGPRQP